MSEEDVEWKEEGNVRWRGGEGGQLCLISHQRRCDQRAADIDPLSNGPEGTEMTDRAASSANPQGWGCKGRVGGLES